MNVNPPHDIVPRPEIPPAKIGHYLPLTNAEPQRLGGASEAERAEFIAQLSLEEKTARWLEAMEAPQWIAYRARRGDYNGKPKAFEKDMKRAGCFGLLAALRAARDRVTERPG